MGRIYADDNFGVYDIESDDDVNFYNAVQKESVLKKCEGCGHMKKLRPSYGYCNRCADRIERGDDF